MRQLVLFLSLAWVALLTQAVAAPGGGDSPGYYTSVKFYKSQQSDPRTLAWSAVFRGNEVEFDSAPIAEVKTFCVNQVFMNPQWAKGYIVQSEDNKGENRQWFYMPANQGGDLWCFNAQPSYRFDVWMVKRDGTVLFPYPVNFEIEQRQGRFVTDLRQHSPQFKRSAQLCGSKFCRDIIKP